MGYASPDVEDQDTARAVGQGQMRLYSRCSFQLLAG